jgi:hypothetical protein
MGDFYMMLDEVLRTAGARAVVVSPIANKSLKLADLHFGYLATFSAFENPRRQFGFKKCVPEGRLAVFDTLSEGLALLADEGTTNIIFVAPHWLDDVRRLFRDAQVVEAADCAKLRMDVPENGPMTALPALIDEKLGSSVKFCVEEDGLVRAGIEFCASLGGHQVMVEPQGALPKSFPQLKFGIRVTIETLLKALIKVRCSVLFVIGSSISFIRTGLSAGRKESQCMWRDLMHRISSPRPSAA